MEIQNAELSLFKASDIQSGDVVLVRVAKSFKDQMTGDKAQELYKQIKYMIGEDKNVGIFFFPKDLDISIIKGYLEQAEQLIGVSEEPEEPEELKETETQQNKKTGIKIKPKNTNRKEQTPKNQEKKA